MKHAFPSSVYLPKLFLVLDHANPARFFPGAGIAVAALLLAASPLVTYAAEGASRGRGPWNGFDVSNAKIPVRDILLGGPGRDGIPAIDWPRFIRPTAVNFLRPDDPVLGVTIQGRTRAYPLRILVWHEIVNDVLSGRPIAVTYCPLGGTAMVFDRKVGPRTLSFGGSGLLYHSDVLMYDRQTESLWSQLAMKAVSGPLVNAQLEWLPSEHLTSAAWKPKYPPGEVHSTQTGFFPGLRGHHLRGLRTNSGNDVPRAPAPHRTAQERMGARRARRGQGAGLPVEVAAGRPVGAGPAPGARRCS